MNARRKSLLSLLLLAALLASCQRGTPTPEPATPVVDFSLPTAASTRTPAGPNFPTATSVLFSSGGNPTEQPGTALGYTGSRSAALRLPHPSPRPDLSLEAAALPHSLGAHPVRSLLLCPPHRRRRGQLAAGRLPLRGRLLGGCRPQRRGHPCAHRHADPGSRAGQSDPCGVWRHAGQQ